MKRFILTILICLLCSPVWGADYSLVGGMTATTAVLKYQTPDTKDTLVLYYGTTSPPVSTQAAPALTGNITFDLSGLSANTLYYYRFKVNGVDGTIRTFRTSRPTGTSFSFLALTDLHVSDSSAAEITAIKALATPIATINPDFIVDLGDLVGVQLFPRPTDNAEIMGRYAGTDGHYSNSGMDIYSTIGYPVYYTAGNHEYGSGSFATTSLAVTRYGRTLLPLPQTAVATSGEYYSFVWGDATFIFLEPYSSSDNGLDGAGFDWDSYVGFDMAPYPKWSLGAVQQAWFLRQVQNAKTKLILVFIHNMIDGCADGLPYARGGAGCIENMYEIDPDDLATQNFTQLFTPTVLAKKNLMFIMGHDHLYADEALSYSYSTTVATSQSIRIIHVPDPKTRQEDWETVAAYAPTWYGSNKDLTVNGFLKFDVSSTGVTITPYDISGTAKTGIGVPVTCPTCPQ